MKKAHIYTFDVLVAFVILIVGLSIIYYAYPVKNKVYYNTERISEDIIAVLVETKIDDLCTNPGLLESQGCDCPNYEDLETLVCTPNLNDKEANILSLFTEIIESRTVPGTEVQNVIREIFVEKIVIDEKRFGFAIIYTTPETLPNEARELYNTETAAPLN